MDVQFYTLLEYMEKIALTVCPLCTRHQAVVSLDWQEIYNPKWNEPK